MVRLSQEVAQLEMRHREKENDFWMIILKIKELKRTFQGNYIQKVAGSMDRQRSKKRLGSRSDRGESPSLIRSKSKKGKATAKKSLPSDHHLNHSEMADRDNIVAEIEAETSVNLNNREDDYDESFAKNSEDYVGGESQGESGGRDVERGEPMPEQKKAYSKPSFMMKKK